MAARGGGAGEEDRGSNVFAFVKGVGMGGGAGSSASINSTGSTFTLCTYLGSIGSSTVGIGEIAQCSGSQKGAITYLYM